MDLIEASVKKLSEVSEARDYKTPSYTHRHYEDFAEMLGKMPNIMKHEEAVGHMVHHFKKDNPKFDEERFRSAVKKHRGV